MHKPTLVVGFFVLISVYAAEAQPMAPPQLGHGLIPSVLEAIMVGTVFGAILFNLLRHIGLELRRTKRNGIIYERIMTSVGVIAWIGAYFLIATPLIGWIVLVILILLVWISERIITK